MTSTERAWVAGLIEGEGSFTFNGRGPRIAVRMTDEDVVRRLPALTGVGRIYAEKRDPPRKPTWVWVVAARLDAFRLMKELWPLMGQRRRQRMVEVWLSATLREPSPA